MNQTMKYGMVDAVRLCPEAWQQNPIINGGNRLGGAYYAWGPDGAALKNPYTGESKTGSYGINGYLYRAAAGTYGSGPSPTISEKDEDKLLGNASAGADKTEARKRLYRFPVRYSAEVPLVADAIWDNGWPAETDGLPTNLYNTNSFTPMMGRFCIARHQRAVNMAFLDGHATMVPLQDLWTLKWHARWAPMPAQLQTIRNSIRAMR
jgi:prepilin-type processing-associated H-X9-DG protein